MVQGSLVILTHSDEASSLFAPWTLPFCEVVGPEGDDERIGGFLEQFNDRVVEWVFVLVKPPYDCVANLLVWLSMSD